MFSGHYCEFAVTVPEDCPQGTYMPYGVASNGTFIGEGRQGLSVLYLSKHKVRTHNRWSGNRTEASLIPRNVIGIYIICDWNAIYKKIKAAVFFRSASQEWEWLHRLSRRVLLWVCDNHTSWVWSGQILQSGTVRLPGLWTRVRDTTVFYHDEAGQDSPLYAYCCEVWCGQVHKSETVHLPVLQIGVRGITVLDQV